VKSDKLLFLTGKLAENSLNKVLLEVQDNPKTPKFKYRVEQIGVSVAALMTPEMIVRRLKNTGEANKMILPGLCQGDLSQLHRQYGIPVERGPDDLKDLPEYFGQAGKAPDLSKYSVKIFAEIVDAPDLTVEQILAKAMHFKVQGANVIDLGCLPGKPFKALFTYKNIKHVYWRQVKIGFEEYQKILTRSYNNDSLIIKLTSLKPLKEWNTAIPDQGDYQELR